MPEVRITIGGRQFEVACQEGEESYLHSAAKMLDDEAQVLSDQVGRMPEARMLLMAGLLRFGALPPAADPANPTKDEYRATKAAVAQLQQLFATH